MKKRFLSVSTAFIVLFSVIYFFDDRGFLAALIPAVLVHEAGHCLCLRAFGAKLKSIRLDLTGAKLSYTGQHMNLLQELSAALSGPSFGLIYAFVAAYFAEQMNADILNLSAGISFILSVFNLLPAMPLDGGRALLLVFRRFFGSRKSCKVSYLLSLSVSLLLLVSGIWCIHRGYGFALILSGVWLLLAASEDACKIREFVIQ